VSGDFVRAELWLERSLGAALLNSGLATRSGDGAIWRWEDEDHGPDLGWEFRVRFEKNGQTVGRLSLWHSPNVEHVLTDMRLIATELQPALHCALLRAQMVYEHRPPALVVERSLKAVG
jgi:hypothetical protein